MRATLSPAFTSSKMKAMFSLVIECAEQLSNFYVEKMNDKENKGYNITIELLSYPQSISKIFRQNFEIIVINHLPTFFVIKIDIE